MGEGWTGTLVEVRVGGKAVGDTAGSIKVGVAGTVVVVVCVMAGTGLAVCVCEADGRVVVGCPWVGLASV